jgi:threonine/homoserine/homoserine lactone efflux protein
VHPAEPTPADDASVGASWRMQALKGAGVSGLNPKALLLFLALLPQFTDVAYAWPMPVQIMVLGLVHTLSCAAVYSGVGVGARAERQVQIHHFPGMGTYFQRAGRPAVASPRPTRWWASTAAGGRNVGCHESPS